MNTLGILMESHRKRVTRKAYLTERERQSTIPDKDKIQAARDRRLSMRESRVRKSRTKTARLYFVKAE